MSSSMPSTGNFIAPADLAVSASRMMGLTGFVSNLCQTHDQRPRIFCRYYHVRRVAWTADLLWRLRGDFSIDAEQVRWFSWAHDLNRWPFAHNSEKGVFDQASDLPRYLSKEGIVISEPQLHELQAIVDKDYSPLGPAAELVLLADMITGFIEDPLWLIAVLNVTPKVVPSDVADYLCLSLDDRNFLLRLKALNTAFVPGADVNQFVKMFDAEFGKVMLRYIQSRKLSDPGVLGAQDFERYRSLVKEKFMRQVVFPYNNELISHGSLIKEEIILPLLPDLGPDAAVKLTRLTDEQCLDEAVNRSIIDIDNRNRYYPELDYMRLNEPSGSFCGFFDGL